MHFIVCVLIISKGRPSSGKQLDLILKLPGGKGEGSSQTVESV